MKNWKTTLLGSLTIISAISGAGVEFLKAGVFPNFAVLIPVLLSGWALIHSADASSVSK